MAKGTEEGDHVVRVSLLTAERGRALVLGRPPERLTATDYATHRKVTTVSA